MLSTLCTKGHHRERHEAPLARAAVVALVTMAAVAAALAVTAVAVLDPAVDVLANGNLPL